MPDDRDFEHQLRAALHTEADGLPLRVDPATVRERMTSARLLPDWLLPIALPIGAAVLVAVVVVNAFPGEPGLSPGAGPSATSSALIPEQRESAAARSQAPEPVPTPHPARRTDAAVAHSSDRLYLLGGRSGGTPVDVAVAFDGLTWIDLPPLPDRLVHAAAVASEDGRVFVFGGEMPADPGSELDTTYVLEPGADAWVAGPPMPFGNASMASVAVANRAYLVGGTADGHERDVLILDLDSATWLEGTPLPVALDDPIAAAIGSDIYVISTRIALRYETVGGTWEVLAEPPLIGLPRAVVAASGKLWLVGGQEGPHERYPGVAALDPVTGTWTRTETRLSPGNTWLQVYVSGDRLFVMAGHQDGITSDVVETGEP